ncbi:MAG: TetR/AcrR family transcriptional regulator [Bacteroidales bacterium]|nr:TetR/AcrR family transcriptional regulator [Bacteroidales bacterium]
MPKAISFTREKITRAVIDIIRSDGSESLTSRAIARRLGCSVTPLFREYRNMEEIHADARKAAEMLFSDFLADASLYEPAFKEFGIRLIRFSREEPNLFRYLFLEKGGSSEIAHAIGRECLKQTESTFELTPEQSDRIFNQVWTFACGLAALCSKSPEVYTDGLVSQMLSTQFMAQLILIKSEHRVVSIEPMRKQR